MDGALRACSFGSRLCKPRLKYEDVVRCVENAYKKGAMDGRRNRHRQL
jgi:hypothetical protein